MSQREKTPVNILVKTEVTQEGEFKEFLIDVNGHMVVINDVLYLRYDELLEGVDKPVPVTIKVLPDGDVTLIRSGEVKMKLNFSFEQRRETTYSTPYGMMSIFTLTNHLHVSLKDNPTSGDIAIDYDLFAGEEKLGMYHLVINFTAK
ncbi:MULTISPECIES: DUF1934 domain-containing protein [Vagococcus]|nr:MULTISPECIES: DUF1934 domain-containing protein [Vagococcus]RHH69581.1 DUF1934 domain-containing protein [Vagococcus sp. AM17-17]